MVRKKGDCITLENSMHCCGWVKNESQRNHCLQEIQSINLNACQKITDLGLKLVARSCPKLKCFSIYWNLRWVSLHFLICNLQFSFGMIPFWARLYIFILIEEVSTSVDWVKKWNIRIFCTHFEIYHQNVNFFFSAWTLYSVSYTSPSSISLMSGIWALSC